MTPLSPSVTAAALLLAAVVVPASSHAADGFEKVQCGRPIVPAIVGTRSSREPVVRIEARRTAIGLKDLGAEEIVEGVNTIYWLICGRTYAVLDVRGVYRDAVELPAYSAAEPLFSTTSCTVGGRTMDSFFLGVFEAASDGVSLRKVKAGWEIDRKAGRFHPLASGASCAADGVFAPDIPG